jgi:Xaa-Pro aminopeptidase
VNETTMDTRLEATRAAMAAEGLAALVVYDPKNIRYLCGFTGEDSCLVVTGEDVALVSDFRFRLQAAQEAPSARLVEVTDKLADALPEALGGVEGEVGVESSFLTLGEWADVDKALAVLPHRPVKGVVEKLREVKSREEQQACRAAGQLVAATIEQLTHMAVVGRSEIDVALELELWARRQGSGRIPFDYIVGAGPRGAMPHGIASRAVIPPHVLLVVDIGVTVDGYASDMTRTFATGTLSARELEVYDVVRLAQTAGRAVIKPGAATVEVDGAARRVIEDAGMGDLFKHSLGHGVGLDIHEAPRLSPRSTEILAVGNVVTVEPGVYVEGLGGVRIEDTVIVSDEGCEVVTELTRELITLS